VSARSRRDLEDVVGVILLAGVLTSAAVIALGLLLLMAAGTGAEALLGQLLSERGVVLAGTPTSVGAVVRDAARGDPVAVILLGVLLLICTPILRVVAAGYFFLRNGERGYALASAIVLALLLLGFVLGAST
jgi:uncharacterized membrane protein